MTLELQTTEMSYEKKEKQGFENLSQIEVEGVRLTCIGLIEV